MIWAVAGGIILAVLALKIAPVIFGWIIQTYYDSKYTHPGLFREVFFTFLMIAWCAGMVALFLAIF